MILSAAIFSLISSVNAFPFLNAAFAEPIAEDPEPVGSTQFWWKLAISIVLVLSGGVFAG